MINFDKEPSSREAKIFQMCLWDSFSDRCCVVFVGVLRAVTFFLMNIFLDLCSRRGKDWNRLTNKQIERERTKPKHTNKQTERNYKHTDWNRHRNFTSKCFCFLSEKYYQPKTKTSNDHVKSQIQWKTFPCSFPNNSSLIRFNSFFQRLLT